MIKIDNMEKLQNVIKKYNKIIFKLSFIPNFTNLKYIYDEIKHDWRNLQFNRLC